MVLPCFVPVERFISKELLSLTPRIFRRTTIVCHCMSSVSGQFGISERATTSSESMGLYRLLGPHERELLAGTRQLTAECRHLAADVFAVTDKKNNILSQLESSKFLDLDATFSVVVAGEFNAGKSTLINALLGQKKLQSGVLPTTSSITIVAANECGQHSLPPGVEWHTLPNVHVLEDLTLIDTPGTNSTWLDHTERTLRLLPTSDMILFVTSADRPFSESERTLLKGIQEYRKSIVIVVNKMDILDADGGDHGKDAKEAVVNFVTEMSSELLGARPIVIPVSARNALTAKLMEKKNEEARSNIWHRSQFGVLERFLKDSLTAKAKLKSKIANPIGVAQGVLHQCTKFLDEQSTELQSDTATIAVLESHFGGWKKDLVANLLTFQQRTTKLVRNQGERSKILVSQMSLVSFHYSLLIDRTAFDEAWKDAELVMASHVHKSLIEDMLVDVEEVSELVATRSRAQGQALIEYLGTRPAVRNFSLVGKVTAASRFEDTRKNLSERLSSAIKHLFRTNKEEPEKEEVFAALRTIAAISAGLQTGAILSALAIPFNILEPLPGFLGLSSLALGSSASYIVGTSLVAQKNKAKWLGQATDLDTALSTILGNEMERVSCRVLDCVGPYTRFVESEQERISTLRDRCDSLASIATNLRSRVGRLS